jgi:transposase InsO family protein
LAQAVITKASGGDVNVVGVCRELGVSRKTFYKYLARFHADGLNGLFPRSRAPLTSPSVTSAGVAEAIVRARKELDEEGGYNGAISIRWRLEAKGMATPPSRATIHRVLVRRGLVVAQPRRRPRSSAIRRFEASAPNDMWQMDSFEYLLASGQKVAVIQIEDDYSRLDLADRAARSENAADVWTAVQTAMASYGLPRLMLTDNASAFNGHRRGFTTDLEARLRALGVTPISSTPRHPQTCGKSERGHETEQKWLAKRPPAADLPQLQALLDAYREYYNNRRHQGIGGLTPQQRWDLRDKTQPDGTPIAPPPLITRPTVSPRGAVGVDGHEIALGKRHAGAATTVFRTGDHVTIFIGAIHIRTLDIDRRHRYQPSGITPTGRPPKKSPTPTA